MSKSDRQKTIIQEGQKVNFVDLGNSFLPAFEKITSVLVLQEDIDSSK